MPELPPDYDPFARKSVYARLKVDAYSPDYHIKARLEELEEELKKLDADSQEHTDLEAALEEAGRLLDNPRRRVLANALELDRLNAQNVIQQLAALPDERRADDLRLPDLNISEVFVEGASPELARGDFQDVQRDDDMQLDLHAVEEILRRIPEPRHVSFES